MLCKNVLVGLIISEVSFFHISQEMKSTPVQSELVSYRVPHYWTRDCSILCSPSYPPGYSLHNAVHTHNIRGPMQSISRVSGALCRTYQEYPVHYAVHIQNIRYPMQNISRVFSVLMRNIPRVSGAQCRAYPEYSVPYAEHIQAIPCTMQNIFRVSGALCRTYPGYPVHYAEHI